MARVYEADGWKGYIANWRDARRMVEPIEREIEVVGGALSALVDAGVLAHCRYDETKMLAHRKAVWESFEIPWTAISPRMQRLLYAINAITQPQTMVAVGIFCGYTFISNAGAAIGPGACYRARRLVGLEIRQEEAERARRNIARIDLRGLAEVIAEDGVAWLRRHDGSVDLLYLDADGRGGRGKSVYLDLVQAAWHSIHTGTIVLAHNSLNHAAQLADYLEFVRDPRKFRESVNVIIDDQGLEVSLR